jgi:hypothetical protein
VLGRESDVQPLPCDLTFPRVHLLPNGRIFRATPVCDVREAECRVATDCKSRLCKQDDATERKNCEDRQAPKVFNVAINPRPESLSDRDEISVRVSRGPGKGYGTGDYGWTSALLPLTPGDRYRARVLLAGRPQPQYVELGTDTGAALETWRDTCPRHPAMARRDRTHANATILPTGEVFVSGGISGGAPVREGEIYDPFCGMGGCWRTVRVASVPRAYHSVALLMPDGRVWHAGTSIQKPGEKGTAAAEGKGLENQEERVELYEPWYYGRTRPVLRTMTGPRDPLYPGAPVMHLHDSGVTVVVDHFRAVTRFALIRTGAVTHAFNFDQRYVELNADLERLDLRLFPVPGLRFTFRLASPPSSNVAPPGNYLLFALDDRGVPSVGRFIRIDRRFVGELEWEAEDFTSRSGSGISVPGDGAVALSARTDPFTSFPRLEYGGIDFGPERGVVRKFSVVGRGTGDPPHGRGHGALLVHLDRPDGPVIARVALRGAPGPVEHVVDVAPVSGVHDVHIRYVTSLLGLPGDPATATARIEGFTFAP